MKRFNILIGLSSLGLLLASCGGNPGENPAHEHQWGSPSYSWASDYSTCTAKRVCELDSSHLDTEVSTPTYEVIVEPTTSSDGQGVYTAIFNKEYFVTQTKTVVIPPIGHTHTFSNSWEFNESTHWHPSTCGHDVKGSEAEHAFDVVTIDGVTTYSCSCGYSYSVGGNKFYEYKDNPDFVKTFPELNSALKALLNTKNFTMQRLQSFTADKPYYSRNPSLCFYASGDVSSYAKFDHREYEATVQLTGEIYASLQQILTFYSASSWKELVEDENKCFQLGYEMYKAFSSFGEVTDLVSSLDFSKAVVSDNKVVLIKNSTKTTAQFYDATNEQYYYIRKIDNDVMNKYIVPDNYEFQNIDLKYSVLEQINYYSSNARYYELEYDEATHSYNSKSWGSGSSRFSMRNICPIVVEDGVITSLNSLTIKDIGTTSISVEKTIPSCNHSHGAHSYWFNDDFHAEYCDDCGKAIRKHNHSIHNEHDICVECESFANGLNQNGFERYICEYQDYINGVIYVNPDTGKKYASIYYSSTQAKQSITGKDGKVYEYFKTAPVDEEKSEISFATKSTPETSYIQDNSCIYVLKYELVNSTYDVSYAAISDENIPEEIYSDAEYLKAHYFCATKEFKQYEVLETVYTFPELKHSGLDEHNELTAITFEEAYANCNYIYDSYKNVSVTIDVNEITFVKTTCSHCGKCLYSGFGNKTQDYFADKFGNRSSDILITGSYKWNSDYTECVATVMIMIYQNYDYVYITIDEESGVVVNNVEESTITATFTNPIFRTQTLYYY